MVTMVAGGTRDDVARSTVADVIELLMAEFEDRLEVPVITRWCWVVGRTWTAPRCRRCRS